MVTVNVPDITLTLPDATTILPEGPSVISISAPEPPTITIPGDPPAPVNPPALPGIPVLNKNPQSNRAHSSKPAVPHVVWAALFAAMVL